MGDVTLHVYDLDEAPGAIAAIGLGAYHSAVQIGAKEYAYGACDEGTGVWFGAPKQARGFIYKKSVAMGSCHLPQAEVDRILELMMKRWAGADYDLLKHNCNHFSSALTKALVQKDIPSWVNRAARWGAGLTNVFGRPKALGPEKPACIAAQHSTCGRAVMEGPLKVQKRPGVWKERYCVLDENARWFVFSSEKHRAKAEEAQHVLDLAMGAAEFEQDDDGVLELALPRAKVLLRFKCEQTARSSRDEVLHSWCQALRHALQRPSTSRQPPECEWSCAACTMINPAGELECVVCGGAAPDEHPTPTAAHLPAQPCSADMFKSRVFCVVASEGLAYRSTPRFEDRLDALEGPAHNDLIVSEMLVCGLCGTVFAKCATGIGWLPLTQGSRSLLEELPQPGVHVLSPEQLASAPAWDQAQSSLRAEGVEGADSSLARYAQAVEHAVQTNESRLEPGWQVHFDPSTGQNYYHHLASGETTWHPPTATPTAAPAPSASASTVQFRPSAATVHFRDSQPEVHQPLVFQAASCGSFDEVEAPASPRNSCDKQGSLLYPSLSALNR